MIRRLYATDDSLATAILRVTLGVVFFVHGTEDGFGFRGTMGFFTNLLHFPAPLAFLAIAVEFFGGMGLLFGFLTRIAAFGIGVNMVVAILTVHRAFGFIRPLRLSCGSVLDWQLTPTAGFTILHQTIDPFGLPA